MQATSSQVTPEGTVGLSVLMMDITQDDPVLLIPADLQKSAQGARRDHLLVRRRRRDTRRGGR